ncbi:hypothetical protein Tco_0906400, partial [Tanacetum coccineum]
MMLSCRTVLETLLGQFNTLQSFSRFKHKISKSSLAKDNLASALQALRRSRSIFTLAYVVDFQDSPDDEEDIRSSLVAKAYEWEEKEMSSDENEMVEVKVLMALADDESGVVGKESVRNADDTNMSIPNIERPWFSKAEGLVLPKHDTCRILPSGSQVHVIGSSVTDYNSAKEPTSVFSTPLPPLEKLVGAEPQTKPTTGTKTIKSILKDYSTRKAETSKDVVINETINTSAPTEGNKNVSASKRNSTPTGKLKNVKNEDDIPMSVCNIRKPIWYLDSRYSGHMTGVKSYLHKYVEQPGPKAVFGDDSRCITEGY